MDLRGHEISLNIISTSWKHIYFASNIFCIVIIQSATSEHFEKRIHAHTHINLEILHQRKHIHSFYVHILCKKYKHSCIWTNTMASFSIHYVNVQTRQWQSRSRWEIQWNSGCGSQHCGVCLGGGYLPLPLHIWGWQWCRLVHKVFQNHHCSHVHQSQMIQPQHVLQNQCYGHICCFLQYHFQHSDQY